MMPCNALANMLLINRNEIWLGSLEDQLRKDLNYKVLQKELIRFFCHKRLWAMCKGRGKGTVSLLLLKKQPNKVSASKFRNPYDANGIGGILSLWSCLCFVGWRQHLSHTSEPQPGSKTRGGACWSPWLFQVASTELHRRSQRHICPHLCSPSAGEDQTLLLCTLQRQTSLPV